MTLKSVVISVDKHLMNKQWIHKKHTLMTGSVIQLKEFEKLQTKLEKWYSNIQLNILVGHMKIVLDNN